MAPSSEANYLRAAGALRVVALAATLVLILPPLLCHAERSRLRINIAGVGTEQCEMIRSGRVSKEQLTSWIQGFWSGLNYVAAASEQKQSLVDTEVMIAEVEKGCRQKPSQILAAAAWDAFLRVLRSSQ